MQKIHFHSPNTVIEFSFWERLYDLKLNHYGLSGNSTDQPIISYYHDNTSNSCIKLIDISLNTKDNTSHSSGPNLFSSSPIVYSSGYLRNVNTIHEFITLDKVEYLNSAGTKLWNEILSNEVITNPALFHQFVLLTFADLKNYKFTHWFGYPTLIPENPFLYSTQPSPFDYENESIFQNKSPIFALVKEGDNYTTISFEAALQSGNQENIIFVINYTQKSQYQSSLSSQHLCPWHARNILAYFALKGIGCETPSKAGRVVKIIFSSPSANTVDISPVFEIFLPSDAFPHGESLMPRIIGWQPNDRGKPGPNILDASSVMNTQRIMEQAVDLNVRLMKWRLWPNLNTELLSSTKCLLLGAGTLGCAVARTLMGWGIRDITFLDNGRVSYSNPARQSLFEYEDCVSKSFKATAAAERLLKIFPGMRSRGEVVSIPMPGHSIPVADKETFVSNVGHLDRLIQEHDVIFALTDSREARWLPTVMCAAHDKLLINAALGFDSYLVMRHGHSVIHSDRHNRLGCYFCMDVAAPGNSQRDRTLDQQCTVTRPGLAQIASGLAAELMVSLLHSPLRERTPAEDTQQQEDEEEYSLLPHQIRGFLSKFLQVQPVCSAFPNCTACSEPIVQSLYPITSNSSRALNISLLEDICNDSSVLEEISGVNKLTAGLDNIDLDLLDEEDEM